MDIPVGVTLNSSRLGHQETDQYRVSQTFSETGTRISHLESLLRGLEDGLHMYPRPDLAPLVNWPGGKNLKIHRWFRYREGFSPQLISELKLSGRLLDPFCGCGSIMVGAAYLNKESVGIDLNPLAVFAARVKLRPLTSPQIKSVQAFGKSLARSINSIEAWPLPALKIARKVFEPEILQTVLRIRAAIEASSGGKAVADFLQLVWLGILQDVGSYFQEGNGIKYRNKKRTRSGYVRRPEGDWQTQRFGDDQKKFVCDSFRRRLEIMVSDTQEWHTGAWGAQKVIEGDMLEISAGMEEASFDSIIFSPPYANRFDYFEAMKVELWFGEFVRTYEDMVQLRKRSLRSHLGADLGKSAVKVPIIEEIVELMDRDSYAWRMRVPSLLRGYFHDMYDVLSACRKLLAPGGRCHIVVGNSAYAGVIIPVDTLIGHLGIAAGFNKASVMAVRHLTVASQQRSRLQGLEHYMRESVVELS